MHWLKACALSAAIAAAVFCGAAPASAAPAPQFTFFYGQGCPHCAKVEAYFQKEDIYAKYRVDKREVYSHPANAAYFNTVMDQYGVGTNDRGVPTVVINGKVITGDEPVISYFEKAQAPPRAQSKPEPAKTPAKKSGAAKLSVPLVVGASIVDAINPCAFAVLLILLSTVLARKGSRRSVAVSGLAFTAAIFVSYILMGLGVYKALGTLHTTSALTAIVGVGAILLGVFNLKDWLWYGKLFKMEVPDGWRPKMKALIMSVTSPAGAFVAGVLVSLFLLPCSSGPYLVILGLLAQHAFDARAVGYLLLYNVIFIVPMLVITAMVYEGSSVEKLQRLREQNLRTLHLIAGIILVALGIFILL